MGRVYHWMDVRVGASGLTRSTLNKVFPDHFSFMLGEVALYAFLILVATGVFLTFFFEPSAEEVVYDGSYGALEGTSMSAAYRSTVELSHDVPIGLLMRQMHHWAALLFLASIVVQAARVFFTGAFRRPRELNWIIGVTMLVLGAFNGLTGYSLPDDLLSGTGLKIVWSITLSIPLAGPWLGFWLFGGEYPAHDIIPRLFVIHVLLVPLLIGALLAVHLAIVWRQKHTHFAGPGRREDNVAGSRFWPTYALRSISLAFCVAGVVALLGGLVQINPVWLYGPADPSAVTTAAQPDWYLGWLEGALRLMPAVEVTIFGYRVPEVVLPGVIGPGLFVGLLYSVPFLDRRFAGDDAEHHVLDRPRDRPVRTAVGMGVLTLLGLLLLGGSQDLLAEWLDARVGHVTGVLQVVVVTVPVLVGLLTWRVCKDLRAGDERARRHRRGTVVHPPDGG
jgi:ubiquinol-cytochrome c reductase cytochrome b subunit